MSERAAQDCRRLSSLRGERSTHEQVWRDVFDKTSPERSSGFNGAVSNAGETQAKKAIIYDSTAVDSMRIFASGLASGMHPANTIWFGLDVGKESEEERRWLDEAARILFENIHSGNFDAAASECHADMGPAGWFVMYTEEKKGGGFHFEQWPLHQCFIASSTSGGLVDTIFREFQFTVEQVVNTYGIDNVSSTTRDRYLRGGADLDAKVNLLWAIYPRAVHAVGAAMARNKPFASMHYEADSKHQLRESGYDEFPCAVPRWRLIPGTPYATGPGADALPDIKTLNDIQRLELANLDIAVSGMWKVVDDGVLNPRTIRIGARRLIPMADVKSMEALSTGADFNVSFAKSEDLRRSIRKILMADQLQPKDGPAMTATEIHARSQMIRQQMGAVLSRLQSEFLQPLIERCFAIAYRAGILGKAPDSLADRNFSVKYISPLARAQRMEEVNAIDVFLMGLAQAAQVDPTVADLVDVEASQREKAAALGVPNSVIRPKAEMVALRKAREEVQAQQAQQQQTAQLGMVAGEAVAQKLAA